MAAPNASSAVAFSFRDLLDLSGGELQVRSYILDLDLNDRALLTFGLEGSLHQLADDHDTLAFLKLFAAFSVTERDAVQRKNPSLTSCHSPLCLERLLTATVKPARAAPLWV